MMEEDNNKSKIEKSNNKKLILVFLIFLITVLCFGISISVLNGIVIPAKDNVINNIIAIDRNDDNDDKEDDKPLGKIVFSYYENASAGNGIDLKNQFPTSDAEGKLFKGENYVFEFKLLLNARSAGIKYTITAEKLVNSSLRNDLAKIYLESNGKTMSTVMRSNGSIKTFNEFSNYSKKNDNEKIIYSGVITNAEARRGYKEFVFKMWLSNEIAMMQEDFGKDFLTRINVYASGDL